MIKIYLVLTLIPLVIIGALGLLWPLVWWVLIPWALLVIWGLIDRFQPGTTVLSVYPIVGHFRYWLKSIGPELHQYFVEAEDEGRPFTKEQREIVYDRAKNDSDTQPFGTVLNLLEPGTRMTMHAIKTAPVLSEEPRVLFGPDRPKPYHASHLNISAMSYGALGPNALKALNYGAKIGGFAHDTGEGGLSPYHLIANADVIWEIGTGYFGCRTDDGNFDEDKFTQSATKEQVKMIEIKLSQGAKPGHGGMLPGAKVTQDIARVRGVPAGQDCVSPMSHSAFDTPIGLLQFVDKLRHKSGGKPTGFKLCIGHPIDFFSVVKAMLETKIYPDFITIDGAEGGTGAAPFEFSDSVGMTLEDGMIFALNTLVGTNLRQKMRVAVSGKILTGFDMLQALALGADTCNSARGMMLALGCIQARLCHTNHCPTGITTLDPWRQRALSVENKKYRVANFHKRTIDSFLELVAAIGLHHPDELRPKHVFQRSAKRELVSADQLYHFASEGDYLNDKVPQRYKDAWSRARPDHFDDER